MNILVWLEPLDCCNNIEHGKKVFVYNNSCQHRVYAIGTHFSIIFYKLYSFNCYCSMWWQQDSLALSVLLKENKCMRNEVLNREHHSLKSPYNKFCLWASMDKMSFLLHWKEINCWRALLMVKVFYNKMIFRYILLTHAKPHFHHYFFSFLSLFDFT